MNWLAQAAARRPAGRALRQGSQTLDYQQLAAAAAGGSGVLAERRVDSGAVALWQADATLPSLAWLHALWWHGLTVLPVAPALPQNDHEALLRRFGAAVGVGGDRPGWVDASSLPPPGDPDAAPSESAGPATLMLTSGSGGASKAVPLGHRQHEASVSAVCRRLRIDAHDRWLLCLPLDHIGGLSIPIRATLTGGEVIVHRRFDPDAVLEACRTRSVTLMSVVPTMLRRLVERAGDGIDSRLRVVLVGGAPCEPALLTRARRLGLPAVPTWGMTEAASQLATLDPEEADAVDFERHAGLAGRPLDGVEIRIGHGESGETSHGGEILVRGPMLFEGYWNGAADSGPSAEGWFRTGDHGRLDRNGYLHVSGRIRDRIISGGVNVSAHDVEQALAGSGLVADAAVIGLPDHEWGQRVCAVVVPATADSGDSALARLAAWAREHLRPAERPRSWRFVAAVPRTSAGKPDRRRLEALFEPAAGANP